MERHLTRTSKKITIARMSLPEGYHQTRPENPMSAIENTSLGPSERSPAQRIHREQVARLYAALNEILANLRYIMRELPSLRTSDDNRTAITKTCADFDR